MNRMWELKSIDEIAEIGRGRSKHRPRNDPALFGGQYPYVQTANIHNSDLYVTTFSKTYSEFGKEQSRLFEPGIVCVTNAGENTGDSAILGIRACFPDSIISIKAINNVSDPFFLKYSIDMLRKRIRGITKGATQDNLSIAKLTALKLPVPSYSHQKKIGQFLKTYGDLIENNKCRIELLTEAAQQLYNEWFVRFRFPGHEHVKIIEGVPEGWTSTNFGEVANILKGKNITKKKAIPGNVPVVAGGLTPAYFHNKANTNSPVITISASGANAGYINLYHENVWASDCSYVDNNNEQPVYFFYLLLKSRQTEITSMQKGSAQPHVYPKDLMRLDVCLPKEDLMKQFSDIVTYDFKCIKNLQSQNKALVKARDLFLPKLMSGEIPV